MKLSKIVLYIALVVSIVVMGMFYFGGGTDQALTSAADAETFYVPNYTSLALNLAFGLLILAVLAAVIFAIVGFFQAPKQSAKSLLGIVFLGGILLIAYVLSDATPIQLAGEEKLFTDAFKLRLADVCIISSGLLLVATIAAIAFSWVMKLTK